MGRKRNSDDIAIIKLFFNKNEKAQSVYNPKLKCFLGRDNEIWKDLASQLGLEKVIITANGLSTAVCKNYYNLWEIIRPDYEEKDVLSQSPATNSDSSTELSSGHDSVDSENSSYESKIRMYFKEYKQFEEDYTEYKRLDKSVKKSLHKTEVRGYTVFEKYNWTSILRTKINKSVNLDCLFIFKRAKIFPVGPIYAQYVKETVKNVSRY